MRLTKYIKIKIKIKIKKKIIKSWNLQNHKPRKYNKKIKSKTIF
jgi:hypothetical protein